MRTTVTKISYGIVAGAILTTMAIGAGSAASAAELPAGQPSASQWGKQYDQYGYDYYYDGPRRPYRRAARPVRTSPASTTPAATSPAATSPATTSPAATGPAAAPAAASALASASAPAGQVLAQINRVRAGFGAKALAMNSKLVGSAHQHNLVMAGGCGLSHQCSGEGDAGTRISAQGLSWNTYAENIGYGGPVAATDAGQASMAVRITQSMIDEVAPNDGHRRNILNGSLGRIGIDVYRDAKGTVWITQDFSN